MGNSYISWVDKRIASMARTNVPFVAGLLFGSLLHQRLLSCPGSTQPRMPTSMKDPMS
jgi:hypothetical protein